MSGVGARPPRAAPPTAVASGHLPLYCSRMFYLRVCPHQVASQDALRPRSSSCRNGFSCIIHDRSIPRNTRCTRRGGECLPASARPAAARSPAGVVSCACRNREQCASAPRRHPSSQGPPGVLQTLNSVPHSPSVVRTPPLHQPPVPQGHGNGSWVASSWPWPCFTAAHAGPTPTAGR